MLPPWWSQSSGVKIMIGSENVCVCDRWNWSRDDDGGHLLFTYGVTCSLVDCHWLLWNSFNMWEHKLRKKPEARALEWFSKNVFISLFFDLKQRLYSFPKIPDFTVGCVLQPPHIRRDSDASWWSSCIKEQCKKVLLGPSWVSKLTFLYTSFVLGVHCNPKLLFDFF